MNRIILPLLFILIGLSANADYTIQTNQPLYPAQPGIYYNQGYCPTPYQAQYPQQYVDSYNNYQQQAVNPYLYQRPYGYQNNLPYSVINPAINGITTSGGNQIVKNIGRNLLYTMMRGY